MPLLVVRRFWSIEITLRYSSHAWDEMVKRHQDKQLAGQESWMEGASASGNGIQGMKITL